MRQLVVFAIVGLLTTSLAAEEKLVRFADGMSSTPAIALIADTEFNLAAVEPAGVVATTAEKLSYDVTYASEDADCNCCDDQGFRPVCDCGCHVRPLDRWCNYDTPCCTTDCWVDHPCKSSQGNCYLTEDGRWVSDDACCDVWGSPAYRSNSAVRFGWWAVDTDGSPRKIGEYQELESSPFWNVEAISSDGVRTWDLSLSGLDSEANDARVHYYGPNVSADVDYQRYLRRWDHDPLTGFDIGGGAMPGANDNVVSEDLNVGDDYAIRVQELDASFKGRLTKNLKWRLNLWGQRKFGERQANAVAHCFDVGGAADNTCHLLSQSQTIDWLTMEIQPVIEAEFKNVTVEYSRTMRSFGQSDGAASRTYMRFNGFSGPGNTEGPPYNYSIVPENFTQIDRLKVRAKLNHDNHLYANLFYGDTKNKFRDTHRTFGGYDLRLMNTAFDGLDLTGYFSMYEENNELPPFFLTAPPYAPANTYDEDSVRNPLDYTRTRAGVKGRWRPYGDRRAYGSSYGLLCGTSVAGGYEYYQLERDFATYDVSPNPFSQPDSITHQIEFGPSTRWSQRLETYTRYKVRFIDVPLIGVSEYSADDLDALGTFNSSLPEQEHIVEIGGTWTPADNFMATAQFSLINSWHESQFANFTEDSYPIVTTIWYAPNQCWSLTGGYAYFSNWIDQDITLGSNRNDPGETERTRWNYGGENHLASFNANYALSECVQLVGGYEWNRGNNSFRLPASAVGADWTLLPTLSDVIVETQRLTAGVDWQPRPHLNVYLRYVYFDYADLSGGLDSGTSHMALGGAGVNW